MAVLLTRAWAADGAYQNAGIVISATNVEGTGSSFTLASTATITSVDLYLAKNGARAENGYVKVYSDSSGTPNTALETVTGVSGYGTYPSFSTITVNFAGTTILTAGVTYWMFFGDTTCLSDPFVQIGVTSSTGFTSKQNHAGTWEDANNPTKSVAFILSGTVASSNAPKPFLVTQAVKRASFF